MTTIREFRDPDFDDLVALWHNTNLRSYPYVRAHQEHTLSDARQFFRSSVLVECRVWVAATSHELQGLVAVSGSWIRQLAVFPPHQRRGIGTALLHKARECSAAPLRLCTFQRNAAARAFYEHHGFAAVAYGVSPAPEEEPDVEYRWHAA